jgi:selT/selW/selH-like putative selenoprotein
MKAKLVVEYCEECLFLGRALEVAQAVLERFSRDLEAVELRPGHDGVFTVALDGEILFRIGEDGRPPAPEEIVRRVEPKLRRAV